MIQQFPKTLIVGPGPHISGADSTSSIMWSVVIALVPAFIFSMANFGWYAGAVTITAVVSAVATEWAIQRMRKVSVTITDGSAAVTGLLLAFTLPPGVPLYVAALGSVFSIAVAKHAFGGLGMNIWNPALAGRAFISAAYSSALFMPKWPVLSSIFSGDIRTLDAVTMATPCAILQSDPAAIFQHYRLWDLFIGRIPGSIGETSALALLIGAAFLMVRKIIDWRLPVAYILTVALLVILFPVRAADGTIAGFWQASFWADPVFVLERSLAHALSGGLVMGAFFMATDMVTSPITKKGQAMFGAGCGVLVAVIRVYGGYPEGVCYSILLMNTVVWAIDNMTKPKFFGERAHA